MISVGDPVAGAKSLSGLAARSHPAPPLPPPVGSDPFLLLFTSGTTDRPKAVPLSYQNMLSNARLSAPEHGITARDRILSAAPFGHLYGLYSLHLALAVGATTVLLPVFSPPGLAASVAAHRPSALFAGPPHMQACLASRALTGDAWPSLRLIVLSGSALAPQLAGRLVERLPGACISQLWGMTETQAGLYTRPGDPAEVVAHSAGRPSPGTAVRVVNENGEEAPAGREGELQIRGCLLFPGYLDNEAANRAAFTEDHWFRTGDLAVCASTGNVSITGRIKDVINRGGVKYNPREVEDLIDAHPKIQQCAIVPVADEVLGERACCFAVAAPGDPPELQELVTYLLEQGISKVKLPERLELLDRLPLTPTRKVIKSRLHPDCATIFGGGKPLKM